MAVLNKIRQRSLFLILIIALALFSFVLSDLFKNSSAFTGSQDIVATINGQDVNRVDFMNKVELAQRQLGPNGTSTQAMNRVWDLEVRKAIMKTQFDELGLTVEKDQMRDLLKPFSGGNDRCRHLNHHRISCQHYVLYSLFHLNKHVNIVN